MNHLLLEQYLFSLIRYCYIFVRALPAELLQCCNICHIFFYISRFYVTAFVCYCHCIFVLMRKISPQHTSIYGSYLKVMMHCTGLFLVVPLVGNSGCCLAKECKLTVCASASQSDCRYIPTFPFLPSSIL